MGHRSNDQSCTKHRTIPSTTSTMKIAILSLVFVAAVSIDGGVLKGNGMDNIYSIIETIDSAFAALKNNLDKTKLGTNSADNKHDNLKWNDEDKEWVAAYLIKVINRAS